MVKRALLIGINYNSLPDLKLNGCVNDIILMRNVLIDAYGYNKRNITMLRDDGLPQYQLPNRNNILNSLESLCALTTTSDELWVHYSGHGTYRRDYNNDEVDGYDEVIVPLDYETNGTIVDEQLKAVLETAAGTVIISQDCCNSGTGWDLPYRFTSDASNRAVLYSESRKMNNSNIYMFSGSRDDQLAADTYNTDTVQSIGAFTNALVDCLRDGNHSNNLISLRTNINNNLENNGFTQRTEFTSSNRTPDNVILTRNGIVNNPPPPVVILNPSRPSGLMFL
jgi:metacaspase-1